MQLILASKSPRRQFLLKGLGMKFIVRTKEVNESFPKHLKGKHIALYLSKKKASAFRKILKPGEILLTADTIVCINGKVLNKPKEEKHAFRMLNELQGRMHTVHTGVCLTRSDGKKQKTSCFSVATKVFFRKLRPAEIRYYIRKYKPFDKAGSYGAQECLPAGMNPCSASEIRFLKKIKRPSLIRKTIMEFENTRSYPIISRIKGSYFNVMGLPVKELWDELQKAERILT